MDSYDLIILGDGLTAKSLALATAARGLRSLRISEDERVKGDDPRSYALAPSNVDALVQLGAKFQTIEVHKMVLEFGDQFTDAAATFTNSRHLLSMVDDSDLRRGLDDALATTPHAALVHAEPTQMHQDANWVYLNHDAYRAPIAVVASGRGNATASMLGFGYTKREFGQRAIVAKLDVLHPTANTARQLFTQTGPIGVLPAGNARISIVWSVDNDHADALLALDDQDFIDRLHQHIGAQTGAIKSVSGRASFPLLDARAERLYKGRVALMGDAAHVVHPMAGQGLNLGLRDSFVLAGLLAQDASLGQHLGGSNMMANYARLRRPDVDRISLLTRGLDKIRKAHVSMIANKVLPNLGTNERLMSALLAQISPELENWY